MVALLPGHGWLGADEQATLAMRGRNIGEILRPAPVDFLRKHADANRLKMLKNSLGVFGIANFNHDVKRLHSLLGCS